MPRKSLGTMTNRNVSAPGVIPGAFRLPMKSIPKLALALLVVAPLAVLTGCSNFGDTNPTSPEKMMEIRQKQNQERANFKPSDKGPAGAPTR